MQILGSILILFMLAFAATSLGYGYANLIGRIALALKRHERHVRALHEKHARELGEQWVRELEK